MGEVFKLNHCYNMDCLPAMELFPDNYFDLAVVDPPYFSGPERRGFYGSKVSKIGVHRDYPVSPAWSKPEPEYFRELLRVCRRYIVWGCNYFDYQFATGRIVWDAPRNSTELTSHEIGVLLLREKYILDKIKEYQTLPPDQMITSSVMDMRVPGGRGKRKRDGANQQIGMYQKETPAQRILQLQEALNKIHGRILSAAAQMQKNEMDKLHLETEQQRIELLRIRATGEIGEPGDGDQDAVHE